jgi:membrane-associated protein
MVCEYSIAMHIGFDIQEVLIHAGVWVAFGIIFAESGLLIGFFLPGDSLIFTAGLLAYQGIFNLWYFMIGGTIAAIAGDNVGYYIGKKFGTRVFNKEESFFFHKDHIRKAQEFYKKHGPVTIVLARFTPIVRTFAPVLAGVGHMDYKVFFFYNVVGGIVWVFGLGLVGYYVGSLFPTLNIDKYILPVVGAIIVLSVLPGIIGFVRSRTKKKSI